MFFPSLIFAGGKTVLPLSHALPPDCCTRLAYRSLKKIDSEHCNLLQLNIALKISEYQQQQEVDEEEEEEEENMLDLLLH
jgi:hypothetical protein